MMPESEFSQKNLADMLTRLGNVESMLRFTVAASSDIKEHVRQTFLDRDNSAEVYLFLRDGPKTQPEVQIGIGKAQATVSKVLGHLTRRGLVARDSNPSGNGFVWRWSEVEEIVGASRIADGIIRESAKSKK